CLDWRRPPGTAPVHPPRSTARERQLAIHPRPPHRRFHRLLHESPTRVIVRWCAYSPPGASRQPTRRLPARHLEAKTSRKDFGPFTQSTCNVLTLTKTGGEKHDIHTTVTVSRGDWWARKR